MKIGDSGRLKISAIEVGERRRVKKGALAALAKSMDTYGLIHPIVVRDDGMLVAGGRRLEAAKKLGWKSIPATPISKLSDEELREIELEENIRREGLDSYEASAQRMKEIRVIEAQVRNDYAPESDSRYRKRGNRETASRLGVSEGTVRNTKKHVAMADRFPSMKKTPWKQSSVLAAEEYIADLVPEAQSVVEVVLTGPPQPPAHVLEILSSLSEKTKREQRELASLYLSENPDDRAIGASRILAIPPASPQWVGVASAVLSSVKREESRVVKLGAPRSVVRAFKLVISAAQQLRDMSEAEYQKIKKREGF